jgi:HlyD family secretion protein
MMDRPHFVTHTRGKLAALLLAGFCYSSLCLAEDRQAAPKGAAVTVVKATQHCFAATVELSGLVMPKQETPVRPDRQGLKVAEVLVDPGETVVAGQPLARLAPAEGGTVVVQAPVGGLIASSSAVTGAIASAKGEALFSIISRNEFDVVGLVAARDLSKLAVDQPATVRVVGAGEVAGQVRRVAATVEPGSQLGQVFVALSSTKRMLVNASARAIVSTGQSCGLSVPLTAILYSDAGAVVQVVRGDRVETRRVETGLMSAGEVEIRGGLVEGDVVVARAGAMLREGDLVRPVNAGGK